MRIRNQSFLASSGLDTISDSEISLPKFKTQNQDFERFHKSDASVLLELRRALQAILVWQRHIPNNKMTRTRTVLLATAPVDRSSAISVSRNPDLRSFSSNLSADFIVPENSCPRRRNADSTSPALVTKCESLVIRISTERKRTDQVQISLGKHLYLHRTTSHPPVIRTFSRSLSLNLHQMQLAMSFHRSPPERTQ